jgi:hypothetical protein
VDPVRDAGQVWAALYELHPQTGLVPIQLDGLRVSTMFPRDRVGIRPDGLRPWDNEEFNRPENPGAADRLDVSAVLRDEWRSWVPLRDEDDPELAELRWPSTLEWPGLALPQHIPVTSAERQQALDVVLPRLRQAHRATPEARIGLIAASRAADVVAVIGWGGLANNRESVLPLTAVLRSWEDRFGAQLIDVASPICGCWRQRSLWPPSRSCSPTTASTGSGTSPT